MWTRMFLLRLLIWLVVVALQHGALGADPEICLQDGSNKDTCLTPSNDTTADMIMMYSALVDWIRSAGGVIDPRQEIKKVDPNDPSSPPQVYATDNIPEGTVIAKIPWDLIVSPADPEENELCETVKVFSKELKDPDNSKFAPFLKTIQSRLFQIPEAWTPASKRAFRQLMGPVDSHRDFHRQEKWWTHYCGGNIQTDPMGYQAALLVATFRSSGMFTPSDERFQENMVPFVDLYNHANDDEAYNTLPSQMVVGKDVIVSTSRHVFPGEALYKSINFGGEPMETSELFFEFGLIPDYPQRYSFMFESGRYDVDFDIELDFDNVYATEPKHEVVFQSPPEEEALEYLQKELEQLNIRAMMGLVKFDGVPVEEHELIWRYHGTIVTAMTSALETAQKGMSLSRKEWRVTDFTIQDYQVAGGVNLGTYGIDGWQEHDDDDDKADSQQQQPYELFEEFDIGHLIEGHERWDTLVKYRQSLKSPSLSFYVDKVARKRWLPTMGYPQATQRVLKYKFELTESGTLEDEIESLLEELPDEGDYAAKPTHHSETSGVWLVSHDAQDNSTMVSSTARELIPDDSNKYHKRDVATALAKNLHAEAAAHESWILKNVKPGVVIEERFVDVRHAARPPLEFCIFVIWGRVWIATMNEVVDQQRLCSGFVMRNGTFAVGSYEHQVPDYVDWPYLVEMAEALGANKDMFRADVFVGVPASSLRKGATREELKKSVTYAVSECELHPTTVFHNTQITDEAARLWIAGYKLGNYRKVPNTEVPQEFMRTGVLSAPDTLDANRKVREECRLDPLWRGKEERCAQATGYRRNVTSLFEHGSWEFPKHDTTWQENIWSCLEEKKKERPEVEHTPPPLEPKVIKMHPPENPTVVIVENAFSEEEATAVQDLTQCLHKYHKETLLEHRSFDYAGTGGNDCTFLGGFLQLFTPGVARQVHEVGYIGYKAAGWALRNFEHDHLGEKYPFPDPRTTGIRTSGHLSYNGWKELGGHSDDQSIYDVVGMLANPSDYEGGHFFLQPSTSKNPREDELVAKPDRLSAVVFLSEEFHGVKEITGGLRESFGTELWKYPDVPLGILRPRPDMYDRLLKTGSWFEPDNGGEDVNEDDNDDGDDDEED